MNHTSKRHKGRRKYSRKGKARQNKRQAYIKLAFAAVIVVCAIVILNVAVLPHFFPNSTYVGENGMVFSDEATGASYPGQLYSEMHTDPEHVQHKADVHITNMLLTPNEYSRPGTPLTDLNGVVVHYTGNAGTTAEQNRSYFENLKTGEDGTYASSHFVIGLDGEIIQCIPLDEISYASNERNSDTISIECCHPDETGAFTEATYQSLIELTTWLCEEFDLTSSDVIRHYDVTGKECPLYFVEHEDAWNEFRATIDSMLNSGAA